MSNIQDNIKLNWYLFVIFIIVLIIHHVVQRYYKYRQITSKVPALYGLPFLGIIHRVVPINKFLYKVGLGFENLKTSTYFIWLGCQPLLITIDPNIIKHVLTAEEFLNKANVLYQSMDYALPRGLITSKVIKWKHDRKLMNSTFAPQIIQRFIPIFQKCIQNLSNQFDALSGDQEQEIFAIIREAFMQVTLETTMGIVVDKDNDLDERLVENINIMFEKVVLDTALSPIKLGFLVRTQSYRNVNEYLKTYLKKLIASRSNTDLNGEGSEFFINRAMKLQQNNSFHIQDTIIQTYTMVVASYETSSATLYSLIVMLSMHPGIQERLYQDILKIIPDSDTLIAYEHLEQLPYLSMILDETLRLMPPIPIIGRETLESCYLTRDIVLPRDFQVLISIFHLHRDKQLWGPDADKFNPDNFLPANKETRHPYAFIPFSKGVRNCIGSRYSEVSLRLIILGLVRKFKFSTSFQYKDLYFLQKISIQFLKEPKIEITKRY